MNTVVDRTNWVAAAASQVNLSAWSAIVAAAGKGSRLGYHRPKILFPVAGKTILEWLLELLLPFCETAVFVVSPEGRAEIEDELETLAPGRYRVCVQSEPTGMGDAVAIGAAAVRTPQTAVIWGDQVAIRKTSLEAVLRLQQGPWNADVTVPTVIRAQPYIHFERDAQGNIVRLLQAREGDTMPAQGESDTGLFCFRTEVLQCLLRELRQQPEASGSATAEFNLLPVIPFASRKGLRVLTPRLMDIEETVGINSIADAQLIEPYLRGGGHG